MQQQRGSSSHDFLFSQLFLPQEAVGGRHALHLLLNVAEAVVIKDERRQNVSATAAAAAS